LENAKAVGLSCEDTAHDIKVNLAKQTDQMQNKILKNLVGIQGQTNIANRLLTVIKKERMKNRLILYSIFAFLIVAVVFILYNFVF
jgi:hypothetical protein